MISQQEKIIKKFERVLDTKNNNTSSSSNGNQFNSHQDNNGHSGAFHQQHDPLLLNDKLDLAEITLFNVLAQENRKLKDRNIVMEKQRDEIEGSHSVTRLKQVEKELDDARAK